MIVLLNVALMCACACMTFLRSRLRARCFFCAMVVSYLSALAGRLADAADSTLGALAPTRVGVRALAPDGQAQAMPNALVGADLDLALDVVRGLTTEVTLHAVLVLDVYAQALDLLVGELADPGVRVDVGRGERLLGARATDSVDVGECDDDPLLARDIDACDTCHGSTSLSLDAVCVAGSRRSPARRHAGG